jgi:hypothetical protein
LLVITEVLIQCVPVIVGDVLVVNATAASQAVPVFVGFVRLDTAAVQLLKVDRAWSTSASVGVQLVLLHLHCDVSWAWRWHFADVVQLAVRHSPALD